jgi:hypothetical protein
MTEKMPKFGQVRRATDRVKDALIFFRGKAMFGDDFGRDFGHAASVNVAPRRSL